MQGATDSVLDSCFFCFLSEWQGRNDEVISSATHKKGDMRFHRKEETLRPLP